MSFTVWYMSAAAWSRAACWTRIPSRFIGLSPFPGSRSAETAVEAAVGRALRVVGAHVVALGAVQRGRELVEGVDDDLLLLVPGLVEDEERGRALASPLALDAGDLAAQPAGDLVEVRAGVGDQPGCLGECAFALSELRGVRHVPAPWLSAACRRADG